MQQIDLRAEIDAVKTRRLRQALRATGGDVRAAARILSLTERTLWRWLGQLELEPGSFRTTQKVRA